MPVVTDFTSILSDNETYWSAYQGAARAAFVTYSFETAPASYLAANGYSAAAIASFVALDASLQATARSAMNQWAAACGITAFEVPSGRGDIRFSAIDTSYEVGAGYAGYADFPVTSINQYGAYRSDIGGDVFVEKSLIGHYSYFADLFLHEIGHAIGFKHPFEGAVTLDPSLDNSTHTVMSYNGPVAVNQQLGTFDLQAAQFIYGPNSADGSQVASWSWDPATYTLAQTGFGGDDRILGVATNDVIHALGGNDWVAGFEGGDMLDGGAGDDMLDGGAGADTLYGGTGDDSLLGGAGDDAMFGQDGDDAMWAGDGADSLAGGAGGDWLWGEGGDDVLWGEAGDDYMAGGAGADTMFGQDGGDAMYGQDGGDTMFGGTGADSLIGGSGADAMYGEDGVDVLWGETGDDVMAGGANNDTLFGQDGNDLLTGGAGNDNLTGGTGSDYFYFESLSVGTDYVWDFSYAESDKFVLQGSAFSMPAGFQLTNGVGWQYGAGAHPIAATATAYYDTNSLALWFDPDGTGPSGGSVVAFLMNRPGLDATSFIVV